MTSPRPGTAPADLAAAHARIDREAAACQRSHRDLDTGITDLAAGIDALDAKTDAALVELAGLVREATDAAAVARRAAADRPVEGGGVLLLLLAGAVTLVALVEVALFVMVVSRG